MNQNLQEDVFGNIVHTFDSSLLKNPLPPAVNWHFWPWCNYGCNFCFATFEDLPSSKKMTKAEAFTIPKKLADARVQKLTFVGGEPTLYPYLG